MSLWGKIKKGVAKAGKVVGTVAQKAAPFAGLIPGVGTLAGMALGAGGSVLAGHNLKSTLTSGAMGGLSGFAGSKLLGGKGIGGLAKKLLGSGVGQKLLGGGGGAAASANPYDDPTGDALYGSDPAQGGSGGAPGFSIGNLVKQAQAKGISIGDLLKGGAAAAGGVAGLVSAHKAGTAMDQNVGKATGIADDLAAQGRAMNARGEPLANAAQKGLLQRLAMGPNPYADKANPFTANFAAPPTAAVAPPPPPMPATARIIPQGAPPIAPAPGLAALQAGAPPPPPPGALPLQKRLLPRMAAVA